MAVLPHSSTGSFPRCEVRSLHPARFLPLIAKSPWFISHHRTKRAVIDHAAVTVPLREAAADTERGGGDEPAVERALHNRRLGQEIDVTQPGGNEAIGGLVRAGRTRGR